MSMKKTKGKYSKGSSGIGLILGVLALLGLVAAAVVFLVPRGAGGGEASGAAPTGTQGTEAVSDTTEPKATEVILEEIDTMYCTFQVPRELLEHLEHREVAEDPIAMNIFSIRTESTEMELFRILFGTQDMGIPMGYLEVEGFWIPVSYTVCTYAEEDFTDKDTENLYYSVMEAFQFVMDSVRGDDRFREIEDTNIVNEKEASLKYWAMMIPEGVEFEEAVANGIYQANFYGELYGQRIDLYSIRLGMDGDDRLGYYLADGMALPVIVESYGLETKESWTEGDIAAVYTWMESVNTAIDVIMSSDAFSVEAPNS